MIMVKPKKNVKTWCFDINLMIQCKVSNTHGFTSGTLHSCSVRVLHGLTKHECYPPLMCNKFQRAYSNEQVIWCTI